MSLVKNIETPPSLDKFPFDLMFDNSKPVEIISTLKRKRGEVYKSLFQEQTKIIQSKMKPKM